MSHTQFSRTLSVLFVCLLITALAAPAFGADHKLKRKVAPKEIYTDLIDHSDTDRIVFKLNEGMGQPDMSNRRFGRTGAAWNSLNAILSSDQKTVSVQPRLKLDKSKLDEMRAEGSRRTGMQLPDLSLYYEIAVPAGMSAQDRVEMVNSLNALDIIETAYFAPRPDIASYELADALTPGWEAQQYYLQAAPTGINAYYGWGFPGGHGEGVKVIDIEGNWIETHEDLHGGTDHFLIAGTVIDDPGWYNHGTAVLGEIASDSNSFGMTGIAYNVDLGTVSVGDMSTADAIATASANADEGDILLIELHAPGPHYHFKVYDDQSGYVAMEYWQENFDAIMLASALGQIVVEAGGNGDENYDDTEIYDSLFYPSYRFSGAIMVGASCANHIPASFTNYGLRIDVHGFGCWDVYTLGYGTLYGTTVNDAYTAGFSGTSSASPIIVGACAVIQGVYKAQNRSTLDHNGMRTLLTTYGTPQVEHYKRIGPLPDLQGSCFEIAGPPCCAVMGDANHNGEMTIVDISYMIDYLYRSGPEAVCDVEADVDGSGQFDIQDINFLIAYLFRGGPEAGPCP